MKSIIILSGGMDSSTLLYFMKKTKYQVKALSFDYNQRHKIELQYASKFCKELKVEHKIIDLKNITPLICNSSLTSSIKVPEGHYQSESMKKTVVPNRNMIMLSIAIGWAENLKYQSVAIANHAGDHHIYPDCRSGFIQALSTTSQLGTYNHISLYAPFTEMTKGDIAILGLKMGIDYSKTYTCYNGLKIPCGKCGSCNERKEALEYAKNHMD